jgi:coenzyme F420-reducing hydrogenase alpha subunit
MQYLFNQVGSSLRKSNSADILGEIKDQLSIDQDKAKTILKSFYPNSANAIDNTDVDLIPIATDILAGAIQGSENLGPISRVFAVFGTGGFTVPPTYLSHAIDLTNGGVQEWNILINGTNYNNPQIYKSVQNTLANAYDGELIFLLARGK